MIEESKENWVENFQKHYLAWDYDSVP